jgi:hypothetical protein
METHFQLNLHSVRVTYVVFNCIYFGLADVTTPI